MRILRREPALVQLDRPARDRQAQTQAAARAIAVRIDAVERIEDSRQRFVGHARTVVANA